MKRERYIWSMGAEGRRWGVALTKQQWIINTLKDFTFPLAHQDPSEAVQREGELIHFPLRSNHCISKPSPCLCLNCCHMQLRHRWTITFVIFSATTSVRWENVGPILLLPANLILRHFPFLSLVASLPFNLIIVPLAALPSKSFFLLPAFLHSQIVFKARENLEWHKKLNSAKT